MANRWGQLLLDDGLDLKILAPPLVGRFQLGPDTGFDLLVVVPVVTAALLIGAARRGAALPWTRLLLVAAAAAALWAVALAMVPGWSWVTRPMRLAGHYLLDVPALNSPREFLSTFTERIDDYGTHVRAHPPGFVLLLWVMDRVGLGGTGWASALVIAGGAAAVPAVLVAVREVGGEVAARAGAPFLVLAPAALWVATTADAFFAGVAAWAVALVVLATGGRGARADGLAVAGGLVFGVTAMLSYGLVLLGAIPLAVAAARHRWRPIVVAGASGCVVVAGFAVAGFWWIEGLLATRIEYLESVASKRPYGYFLVANLAAFAVALGPATAAGLARRLRTHGLRLVVGAALVAVAIAGLSGMSKGEVERIWLPFAIWVLPAAGTLAPAGAPAQAGWLALQAAVAFTVQIGVRTHW